MITSLLCAIFTSVMLGVVSEKLPAPSFMWDFVPENNTDSLLSCGTYSLLATGNVSLDGAQYNIRAFSPNVTPVYVDVGSNASNLQWNVPYPPGVDLFLGLVDGDGNSGEVKGPFSINGSIGDVSCFPNISSISTSTFNVSVNVTAPKSCEPVGMTIRGGTPPYNATIAIEGIGIISRPMYVKDNIYTWFNVAPSGARIIFSAEDKDGILAVASPTITSAGNDETCPFGNYSSRYQRWSLARQVFYWFAIYLPLSLVPPVTLLYILFHTVRLTYHVSMRLAVLLSRATGCGDEEMGSVSEGDFVETRPQTPVGPLVQAPISRPDTPTIITPPLSQAAETQTLATLSGTTGDSYEPDDDKEGGGMKENQ